MSNKAVSIIKSIIPNLLLIISIGLVIIVIIPSGTSINEKKSEPINLNKSIVIALDPCKSDDRFKDKATDKTLTNIEVPLTENEIFFKEYLKKQIPGCIDFKHLTPSKIFLYFLFSSFSVCYNMTNTVINSLSNFINTLWLPDMPLWVKDYMPQFPGIFIFYIIVIIAISGFSKFIRIFMPIDIKISKKTSFIFDILFSLFSVITVLYVLCLLPTTLIYMYYLIKFAFIKDMPLYFSGLCVIMFFIVFLIFLPLILSTVQEGAKNKNDNKKKDNKKNDTKKKDNDKKGDGKKKGNDKKGDGKKKNDGKKNNSKKNDGKKNDGKKNDGKKNDGKKNDAPASSTSSSSTSSSANSSKNNDEDVDKAADTAWAYFSLLAIIVPIAACIYSLFIKCVNGLHDMNTKKIIYTNVYGLIVLVIIVFLEIYAPHINTLLTLF
jgi:Na+-transporting methylmalonyl-CoA/oxaloacetate decarboxylase gamma subunit